MQNIISICLFAFFIIMIFIRTMMLRFRGITAIVFGKTDKSDFLLVPLVLIIAYAALANTFNLPIWSFLVRPFWNSAVPGWAGLALCTAAVIGFALTLASFGNSFRVGIDESKADILVTNGMFAVSRNPIYVCFLMFFIGLFLIHRNAVIAIATVLFTLAIHRQILREEKFLSAHYGTAYDEYVKKVRRYL